MAVVVPLDHLLLVMGEEGVGGGRGGRAARLLDPRGARVIPVLLQHAAVVVLHFRQPVLRIPVEKFMLAGQYLFSSQIGVDDALYAPDACPETGQMALSVFL